MRPADDARPTTGPGRLAAARPLAVLLGLAVVSTAHAPGAIRVQRGDTLSELAQRHGTSVSALRSANRVAGDRIYAGRTLRLPGSGGASGSGQRVHVVRSGENVTVIARRYGVGVRAVLQRNALGSSGRVLPGQRLVVPTGTSRADGARSGRGGGTLAGRAAVRQLVAGTARQYGVSPSLALAVANQESGFQQRVVSSAGAVGVMQVLPSTARGLSRQIGRPLDLRDTRDNVTAGVLLLRELRRTRGSDSAALAAYYQGIGSLARQGWLPSTRAYVRNVLALRDRYAGR